MASSKCDILDAHLKKLKGDKRSQKELCKWKKAVEEATDCVLTLEPPCSTEFKRISRKMYTIDEEHIGTGRGGITKRRKRRRKQTLRKRSKKGRSRRRRIRRKQSRRRS